VLRLISLCAGSIVMGDVAPGNGIVTVAVLLVGATPKSTVARVPPISTSTLQP
jgi:hypothetical protein